MRLRVLCSLFQSIDGLGDFVPLVTLIDSPFCVMAAHQLIIKKAIADCGSCQCGSQSLILLQSQQCLFQCNIEFVIGNMGSSQLAAGACVGRIQIQSELIRILGFLQFACPLIAFAQCDGNITGLMNIQRTDISSDGVSGFVQLGRKNGSGNGDGIDILVRGAKGSQLFTCFYLCNLTPALPVRP